jgi:choline monooxygenase
VIVRNLDGELKAFANVCPHRGHTVAEGNGCSKVLQCHYHGWTFNLNGELRGVPRAKRDDTFDPAGIGLRPVKVDSWGPLVFVNPDVGAPPLSDTLGGVGDLARERDFLFERFQLRARREWEIDCNWKVTLDNNTECYHCATVHPSFTAEYETNPDIFNITPFDRAFTQITPPKRAPEDGSWKDFHLYYLWPNFMISARGNDYFYLYVYQPIDAHRTRQINEYFFPEDVSDEEVEAKVESLSTLMQEDWGTFEQVQIGVRSGVLDEGRPLPKEEGLLRQFQILCARALEETEGSLR